MVDFFDVELGKDLFVQFVATALAAGLGIWIANATNERSHRESLKLQIREEARSTIVSAARRYREWCAAMTASVRIQYEMRKSLDDRELVSSDHEALKVLNKLQVLAEDKGPALALFNALKTYEPVLPELTGVAPIFESQTMTAMRAVALSVNLGIRFSEEDAPKLIETRDVLRDSASLGSDLAFHVNDLVLHPLFGSNTKTQSTSERSSLRLRLDPGGAATYRDPEPSSATEQVPPTQAR